MKQETGQSEESEVTIGESNLETTSESTTTTTVNNSSITGDILMHLQAMITLLRPNDTIILAVKLFSYVQDRVRYLVIVETRSNAAATTTTSTSRSSITLNRQSTTLDYSICDESALLGLELTAIPSTSDDENEADAITQTERLVFFST